jgi:uncharacterized DUF497 family protein
MGQFRFVAWLLLWYITRDRFEFDWDQGNSSKSVTKHGVEADEVESVFELKLGASMGTQITPPVEEERLCVVGPSLKGRLISVVFTLRDGKVRPISSRKANRKEKLKYEEIRKITQGI